MKVICIYFALIVPSDQLKRNVLSVNGFLYEYMIYDNDTRYHVMYYSN